MELRRSIGLWSLILLFGALVALLGLAPGDRPAQAALARAERALAGGQLRAAAGHLAEAAARPGYEKLWEQAGKLAQQAGDPEAALEFFAHLPEDELGAAGSLARGEALVQTGDAQAAIETWQSALEAHGPQAGLYERLAKVSLELGDYPAAIEAQRALVRLEPGNAERHYSLGLLLASQEPETALAPLAQVVELEAAELIPAAQTLRRSIISARRGEDEAYSLLAAGRALAQLDEWALAAEAFRRAAEARPDYAEARAYLGEARQHLEDEEQGALGLADLQTALELDPESLSAHLFLALYHSRRGDYEAAAARLEAARELEPENPAVHAELGGVLAASGDLGAAYEAYLAALELAPRDLTYQAGLILFALQHEYQVREIALPAARRAVIQRPDDPLALDLMGQVLLRLQDGLNAQRFFERALQIDPAYAPAHLHLGQVFLLRGETRRAFQEITLARQLDPEGQVADQSERLLRAYFEEH